MDITLFIIIIIVIVFIYYLINTIKDLQIEIKNMSMSCNKNSTDNVKPLETMEVKMKNDFILLLDNLKNYFI
jgi:hypothetical protein